MDIIKKQKFTQIDTLKFFMCFAVVLFHYRCVFLGGAQADVKQIHFLRELFWNGEYAVEFFFIISGFLIAYNYKEKLPSMGFFFVYEKEDKILFCSGNP